MRTVIHGPEEIELHSASWKFSDELRGGMDASQYKDCVLVLLLVVTRGGSFADMMNLKNDKEIGDKSDKLIGRLADANGSFKGAINVADFNEAHLRLQGRRAPAQDGIRLVGRLPLSQADY